MKKVGFVLSGGGARGFAHLGMLNYMEELNIRPFAISGTSAGAIVGALYASGLSSEEIHRLMKKNNYFGWNTLSWKNSGIFSMKVLHKALKNAVGEDSFDVLKTKLFVAATDFVKGETIYFSDGSLFQSVIASAAVPVVFEPVLLDGKILVDGGVLNNFPIEPLENLCDVIIGSHVNKMRDDSPDKINLKPFHMTERCFHMAISHSVYSKLDRCTVFLDPPLYKFNMFDTKKADEMFEIGYQTAKEQSEVIKKVVG